MYEPAMKTKIIEWSRRAHRASGRRSPGTGGTRACAEHRHERGRVDPRGERRQRTVREHDEHDPRRDRGDEGPLVEDPLSSGLGSSPIGAIVARGRVEPLGPPSPGRALHGFLREGRALASRVRAGSGFSQSLTLMRACGLRIGVVFDHAGRRRRLSEKMRAEGVGLLFLGLSSDLEYLSGIERGIPFFGQSSYAHGWVAGGFFRPDADPVYLLPRMVVVFDLPVRPEGEIVVVDESDDGVAVFERVAKDLGASKPWPSATASGPRPRSSSRASTASIGSGRVPPSSTAAPRQAAGGARRHGARLPHRREDDGAVTPRVQPGVTMAELRDEVELQLRLAGSRTPSFATHVFTGMDPESLDSGTGTAHEPLPTTRPCCSTSAASSTGTAPISGERSWPASRPPGSPRRTTMVAAAVAGRRVAVPARSRVRWTPRRAAIEEAGLGEHFRHRMGHGIGLDVHERPFLSRGRDAARGGHDVHRRASIIVPGSFGLRIENIVVCADGGAHAERLPERPRAQRLTEGLVGRARDRLGERGVGHRHGVPPQEVRHGSSDGLGMLDLQEMTNPSIVQSSTVGSAERRNWASRPHRLGLGTQDRHDRPVDRGRLLGTKRPDW